jgi:hypothetical protein
VLVDVDDNRFARVTVIESVIAHPEQGRAELGFSLPEPL